MADCPKYRYTGSWTQDVLNVFSSDTRGQTPVLSEYVAFEVTANSFNFGPWASAEIHVEGVDELGDVRQSFEYTCATTDTYPKTFGANSLGGATIQLRYYIQVPTNQVGSAISWDFEIQFIGDCVALMPQLYLHSEDQAGFVYDNTATPQWRQLTGLLGVGPDPNWISVMTSPRDNASVVYAIPSSDQSFFASLDAGLTFTEYVVGPAVANASEMVSGVTGDVYFHTSAGSGLQGLWRSTNGGASWTHIVTAQGAGLALGTSKLWYAEQISGTVYIRQCNLDGSGVTTIASTGTFLGQIRAINDDFCIVVSGATDQIIRVGVSGTVTNIKPTGIDKPWDAAILDATSWLIIGTSNLPALFRHGLVYRTDSSGTMQVADFSRYEAWAEHGVYDSYHLIEVPWGSSTEAYVLGHASQTVRQMVWYTADRGTTWTLLENAADPVDGDGFYLVYGPGGIGGAAPVAVLPIVSIPSRLATIVG